MPARRESTLRTGKALEKASLDLAFAGVAMKDMVPGPSIRNLELAH